MRHILTGTMTFQAMADAIQKEHPEWQVTVKKNPLLRFEYVAVRKSALIGVWIRIFEKKGFALLIKAIPAAWVRALLGGLLLYAFTAGAQGKVLNEVSRILSEKFGSSPSK